MHNFRLRRRIAVAPLAISAVLLALTATPLPIATAAAERDSRAVNCGFPSAGPIHVARDTPQRQNALKCGLVGREVRFEGLAVAVPTPGETITLSGIGENGSVDLEVAVDPVGVTTVAASQGTSQVTSVSTSETLVAEPRGRTSSKVALATGGGCGVYSYTSAGHRIAGGYAFYRGDGATPANAGGAAFGDAMNRAGANITSVQNPCGVGDGVAVNYFNQGLDSRESDFYVDGATSGCLAADAAGQDTVNTVDFKPLSSGLVGLACVRSSSGTVVEADVRLNSYKAWTYSGGSSGCTGLLYDVEGLLTHEFGHVYGLDHVSNREQTMYHTAISCDNWQRNLGQGDATGLNAIY